MINTYNADYVVVSYRERENPKKRRKKREKKPEIKEASKMWFNECRKEKKKEMRMKRKMRGENGGVWVGQVYKKSGGSGSQSREWDISIN